MHYFSRLASLLLFSIAVIGVSYSQVIFRDDSELGRRVNALASKGDMQKAVELLDREVDKGKNIETALYVRAEFRYFRQNQPQAAIEDIDRLIAIKKNDPQLLLLRGQMKVKLQDYAAAVRDFDSAIALDASSSNLFAERAFVYGLINDEERALKDYQTAISLAPQSANLANQLAQFFVERKREREAITTLAVFTERELGRREGKLPKIRGVKVKKKVPSDLQQGLPDGEKVTRYSVRNTYVNGPLTRETLAALSKEQFEAEELARTFLALGRLRTGANELDEALEDLARALYIDPNLDEANGLRGVIFLSRNKFSEAIEEFSRAIQIADVPHYYLNRGIARLMVRDENGAAKDLEMFLRIFPEGKAVMDARAAEARKALNVGGK